MFVFLVVERHETYVTVGMRLARYNYRVSGNGVRLVLRCTRQLPEYGVYEDGSCHTVD